MRAFLLTLICVTAGCGADESAPLPDNYGDSLVLVGVGEAHEVVDIESDGIYAYTCGGFGGSAFRLDDGEAPEFVGAIGGRCQRIAIGPVLADGTRVVYVAHHGDSRWATPYLWTNHISPGGDIVRVGEIEDDDVLFEGMAYHDGVLYVAAHAGGLRVYAVDDQGKLVFERSVGGFDNAAKVAVENGHAYVADADRGVHVLSLADKLEPQRIAVLESLEKPRDVDTYGDRLYVALGNSGVRVYDIGAPTDPRLVATVGTTGSAQAVAADGERLAIANWTHFSLVDTATLTELANERVKPPLEQDVGVALVDGAILGAEWGDGLHVFKHVPGMVAPDMWWKRSVYSFRTDEDDAHVIRLENNGEMALTVDLELEGDDGFSLSSDRLLIAPGAVDVVEVIRRVGVGAGDDAKLHLRTNDPDQADATIELRVGQSDLIQVGDTLDSRFGFLDPTGAGQVEGLDGHVVVLAYFGIW